MIQKAIILLSLLWIATTGIYAEEIFINEKKPNTLFENYTFREGGFSNIDFRGQNHMGIDFGIGVDNYTKDGFYYGHAMQISYYPYSDKSAYGLNVDLKGGARPLKEVTVYAILGFSGQAIPNITTPELSKFDVYLSPGVGVGAFYSLSKVKKKYQKLLPDIAELAFRIYRLKHQAIDSTYYDMQKITMTFKYKF